jgi:hypothetical protein
MTRLFLISADDPNLLRNAVSMFIDDARGCEVCQACLRSYDRAAFWPSSPSRSLRFKISVINRIRKYVIFLLKCSLKCHLNWSLDQVYHYYLGRQTQCHNHAGMQHYYHKIRLLRPTMLLDPSIISTYVRLKIRNHLKMKSTSIPIIGHLIVSCN